MNILRIAHEPPVFLNPKSVGCFYYDDDRDETVICNAASEILCCSPGDVTKDLALALNAPDNTLGRTIMVGE